MARLPLITREDLPVDAHHIHDHIQETRDGMPNLFRVLLNSPEAAERVAALGEYIRYSCPLDAGVRETAILSTARELGIHYEWAHHVPVARQAGVREEVINAIREGKGPMGLPAKEGVYVQAAREIVRTGTLSDRTFQAVNHLLGGRRTVDLIVLVGYYTMVGRVLKTLDVELEQGVESDLPS